MVITGLLFRQMLVLFAMMAAGFLAFRLGVFGKTGQKEISALIVRVLNPFLMISSVLSNTGEVDGPVLLQNLAMVGMYFAFLIAASFLYVRLRRFSRRDRCLQQLMLTLSNLGFLGIPVVRAVYGPQYVIYLVFYIMLFNVLAYTYGIYLASGLSAEKHLSNADKVCSSARSANARNTKAVT
ncbi:MAG: AEC family transporter, partial [Lachnospiraceae bacterium]